MTPRGGKRKGAGRKKLPDARVTLAVRVAPGTKVRLEDTACIGDMSIGEVIDMLVSDHL